MDKAKSPSTPTVLQKETVTKHSRDKFGRSKENGVTDRKQHNKTHANRIDANNNDKNIERLFNKIVNNTNVSNGLNQLDRTLKEPLPKQQHDICQRNGNDASPIAQAQRFIVPNGLR